MAMANGAAAGAETVSLPVGVHTDRGRHTPAGAERAVLEGLPGAWGWGAVVICLPRAGRPYTGIQQTMRTDDVDVLDGYALLAS